MNIAFQTTIKIQGNLKPVQSAFDTGYNRFGFYFIKIKESKMNVLY